MAKDGDEVYENFLISEHCSDSFVDSNIGIPSSPLTKSFSATNPCTLNPNSAHSTYIPSRGTKDDSDISELQTVSGTDVEYLSSAKDYSNSVLQGVSSFEHNRVILSLVRLLMAKAPYPIKYEHARALVKQHIPNHSNPAAVNELIFEAKKLLGSIFGLMLCDVKYAPGKRELFIKQSMTFGPHDAKITSSRDHELRGFLLLLIPSLKAYTCGLSLDRLCEIFHKIGKEQLVPSSLQEETSLVSMLRNSKKKRDLELGSPDYRDVADYLLYARDLSYIQLIFDNTKGNVMAAVIIQVGHRLEEEFDGNEFVRIFKTLDMDIHRGLEVLFDTKSMP